MPLVQRADVISQQPAPLPPYSLMAGDLQPNSPITPTAPPAYSDLRKSPQVFRNLLIPEFTHRTPFISLTHVVAFGPQSGSMKLLLCLSVRLSVRPRSLNQKSRTSHNGRRYVFSYNF